MSYIFNSCATRALKQRPPLFWSCVSTQVALAKKRGKRREAPMQEFPIFMNKRPLNTLTANFPRVSGACKRTINKPEGKDLFFLLEWMLNLDSTVHQVDQSSHECTQSQTHIGKLKDTVALSLSSAPWPGVNNVLLLFHLCHAVWPAFHFSF